MSNRHDVVKECVNTWTALVKDVQCSYPDLAGELERDLQRLRDLSDDRGIHLFCVDLPALCKHLDRCLAVGEYLPSKLPLSRAVSAGVVIPRFLRGLYLLIFDGSTGLLKNNDLVGPIRALRQLLSMLKKLDMQCSDDKVESALSDFIADDLALPEPPLYWEGDGSVNAELARTVGSFVDLAACGALKLDNRRAKLLDIVSGIVCSELGSYNPDSWSHCHGPGAISQTTKPTNKYHWYEWTERLDSEFPISEHGFYNHVSWAANDRVSRGVNPLGKPNGTDGNGAEPFSRMVAVPKTFKAPRLIAAEPSEHMWCQQNIWDYFNVQTRASLVGKFIRFTDQTLNQQLCLKGATDGTLATTDLSAASDRVSCDVVGAVFRSNPRLLAALRATRTRQVKMLDGSVHRLRKFSTMGSTCTFPVESLVFLVIAITAHYSRLLARDKSPVVSTKTISELEGSISVFGDDIIVAQTDLEDLRSLLGALRFKINETKTYGIGMFRESCGVDAFRGTEVTPVYMRTFDRKSPEGIVSAVATHNRFRNAGYQNVAKYIAMSVRGRVDRVVAGSTVFGLDSSPDQMNILGRKLRWNADLQRVEIRHRAPRSKMDRVPANDDTGILQFFTEKPSPLTEWKHGFDLRPVLQIKPSYHVLEDVCGM